MRKAAVLGGNGQLGQDVVEALAADYEVFSLVHDDVELSSFDSVKDILGKIQPAIVVNTAAMHHVENCEREPERAYAVNAVGARHLACVTREIDAVLIHVSTDYVFNGAKQSPYVEEDVPLPLNVYGNSKLAGEYFIRSINPKHFVLRTSALYGQHPCRAKAGRNFVDLMLKLGQERGVVRVVATEIVSPTATIDLAAQIAALSHTSAYGLYHATAEGNCSWHEFACEIFEMTGMKVRCEVAGANEFPAKVPRPTYSVLENAGLKSMGLNRLQDWRDSLNAYLEKSYSTVS